MPRYRIHFINTVSTSVEVDVPAVEVAPDVETIIEAAYNSPSMPGGLTVGAFGGNSVDDDGDWEAVVVADDETGEEVWSDYPQDAVHHARAALAAAELRIAELTAELAALTAR